MLPDLEYLIRCYSVDASPTAAVTFMENTLPGKKARRRGLGGFARDWLRNSQPLWMWDYKALARELVAAGFQSIRRVLLGDSGILAFDLVETAERWNNALGIQCT